METELRPAHEVDFGARIDPEPEQEFHPDDSSPIYYQPHPQQQQQQPVHMFHPPIQSQSSSKNLFEDDDKMKYIIPFIAFIIGFFMAKTMQPIIIRPT